MFSAQRFTYGLTQSLGDTAIAYTLTAARWGVLAWDWYTATFFSPKANARYRVIGEIIGHLMILAIIAGKMTRLWFEDEPANEPAVAPAKPVIVAAATKVEPVATLTITEDVVVLPDYDEHWAYVESLKIVLLRRICSTNRVPRAARLTKAQAVAALKALPLVNWEDLTDAALGDAGVNL